MVYESLIQQAAAQVRGAQLIVVLTGAGVSKESGVPTFRDALDGLWAEYDPQQLATPQAFMRNPKLVWDWYEQRRLMLSAVQPNPGHYAIAALEKLVPQVVVVTQNIDGLHTRAGSTDVITMHGDIQRHKCFKNCQGNPTLIDITTLNFDPANGPPACPRCGAWVRPDVVWFGEELNMADFRRAEDLCKQAQVLLVVGTSGEVQPVASLPALARRHRTQIIEINPNMSELTYRAHLFLQGPSGEVLPELVAAVRGR